MNTGPKTKEKPTCVGWRRFSPTGTPSENLQKEVDVVNRRLWQGLGPIVRWNSPGRIPTEHFGWRKGNFEARCHTVDGCEIRFSHHLRDPGMIDSPVKQTLWFQPWLPSGAKGILSIHSREALGTPESESSGMAPAKGGCQMAKLIELLPYQSTWNPLRPHFVEATFGAPWLGSPPPVCGVFNFC